MPAQYRNCITWVTRSLKTSLSFAESLSSTDMDYRALTSNEKQRTKSLTSVHRVILAKNIHQFFVRLDLSSLKHLGSIFKPLHSLFTLKSIVRHLYDPILPRRIIMNVQALLQFQVIHGIAYGVLCNIRIGRNMDINPYAFLINIADDFTSLRLNLPF
jgi:hypothetical protein